MRRAADAGSMWQYFSGSLIAFVIRTPPPCLYSFTPKESIVTRANFVVGDA
jgi:hypothetical protein